MASKIESAATSLISNAVKTFKLSDVTKHKKIPYKNLYEISSQYPGFGRILLLKNNKYCILNQDG